MYLAEAGAKMRKIKYKKMNLDIAVFNDKSFDDIVNLPDPDTIAGDIAGDLRDTYVQSRLLRI